MKNSAELSFSGPSRTASADAMREAVQFCQMNYQLLFGSTLSAGQAMNMAQQALQRRSDHTHSFEQRVHQLFERFRHERAATPGREPAPAALELHDWPLRQLQQIQSEHRGLLIALFHFGAHRHVAVDMAALGLAMVAPIAGQAFWDYYHLRDLGPQAMAAAIKLLEVEKNEVGRQLISELRRGRIGVIYADGNMGPDGTRVEDGGVDVGFLSHKIHVKSGIARLAQAFSLPVLPLFVRRHDTTSTESASHIHLGEILTPPTKADLKQGRVDKESNIQALMQALYDQLAIEVKRDPTNWEFALCFHRWLRSDNTKQDIELLKDIKLSELPAHTHFTINRERVTQLNTQAGIVWVDTQRRKGFQAPQQHAGILQQLANPHGLALSSMLQEEQNKEIRQQRLDLINELYRKQLIVIRPEQAKL